MELAEQLLYAIHYDEPQHHSNPPFVLLAFAEFDYEPGYNKPIWVDQDGHIPCAHHGKQKCYQKTNF
jgi:hypothetical protein